MAQQEEAGKRFTGEPGFQERLRYEEVIFRAVDRLLGIEQAVLFNRFASVTGGVYGIQQNMISDLIEAVPDDWKDEQYKSGLKDLSQRYDDWLRNAKADRAFYDRWGTFTLHDKDKHWFWRAKFHQVINLLSRRGLLLSQDRTDEI